MVGSKRPEATVQDDPPLKKSKLSVLQDRIPPIFKRNTWPDAEKSIGDWLSKLGSYNCWEATGPAREQWIRLAHDIQQYLEYCHDPIPKGVIWCGYMMGLTKGSAKPTVVFCSPDSHSRKQVRKAVLASGILKDYPGFRTAECSKPPDFDQLGPLGDTDPTLSKFRVKSVDEHITPLLSISVSSSEIKIAKDPHTSIYILENTSEGVSKRATASAGITIFGETYLFTVGHIFLEGSPLQHWSTEPGDEVEFDIDEDENGSVTTEEETFAVTSADSSMGSSEMSKNHSEVGAVWYSRQPERASTEHGSYHSTHAQYFTHSQTTDLIMSETKLASETEWAFENWPRPEVEILLSEEPTLDYALIKNTHNGLPILGPLIFDCTLDNILRQPRECTVQIATSRNFLGGKLSEVPTYISQDASPRAQELWTIRSNSSDVHVKEGDCGALVFCKETSELCGHLIAGSPSSGTAYIVPAHDVFDDIKYRLGQSNLSKDPSMVTQSSPLVNQHLSSILGPHALSDKGISLDSAYYSSSDLDTQSFTHVVPDHVKHQPYLPNITWDTSITTQSPQAVDHRLSKTFSPSILLDKGTFTESGHRTGSDSAAQSLALDHEMIGYLAPPNSPSPENSGRTFLLCETCGTRFTGDHSRGNLARHHRIQHRGENGGARTFLCNADNCERVFTRKDSRLKHERRWHPELELRGPEKRPRSWKHPRSMSSSKE